MNRISVIGAGAWGTALAIIANRGGADVRLWTRNEHVMKSIQDTSQNDIYLPEIFLDPSITVTQDLAYACRSELILMVVPAQHMRSICIAMSDVLPGHIPLVICCKGIERGSLALMSEVVQAVLPENPIAVLSGPNFAREVALSCPTATTIACDDAAMGEKIAFALGNYTFRPYWNNDVIGTQIGGAIKNVLAIACGICMGKDLGDNALASLMTRGIAEMRKLCLAKGGREDTLLGLSGVGDLILTCSSNQSRNTSLGYALGQGEALEDILSNRASVTEGVASAESVKQLADSLSLSLPICEAVYDILFNQAVVDSEISKLMERPFTHE